MGLEQLYERLRNCNKTELVQRCKAAGVSVHPDSSKDDIIASFMGASKCVPHPIDKWRDAQMKFILNNWDKLLPQITCPAISGDPKECHRCPEMRVVACLVTSNGNNQEEIEKYVNND